MRILITGICGFVGSALAIGIREKWDGVEIFGFDNFVRPGSELNRLALKKGGISVRHADLRSASDIEALPGADWLIDAAANPSVRRNGWSQQQSTANRKQSFGYHQCP